MPFLITTTEKPANLHQSRGRILAEKATLVFSEAITEVREMIEEAFPIPVVDDEAILYHDAHFDCDHIRDTGGAVGPLPDGHIIAVRHVTINDLWERIGKPAGVSHRQIIDGFNERRKQAA